MRPIDTLRTIGRPIAYHATLARHVGGVSTAVFLGQLMYWDEIANNDLGVYKTAEEWEQETGLTYREQTTARKKLRDLGLLIETKKRLQHRIYYKLDHDAFNSWIDSISKVDGSENGELRNAQSPNDENAIGEQLKRNPTNDESATRYIDKDYQRLHTETTDKNNTKKITAKTLMGYEVDEQVAIEFLELRKRKRANLTSIALSGMQREADKAGITLSDAMRICIERGWQGFKAEWLQKDVPRSRSERYAKDAEQINRLARWADEQILSGNVNAQLPEALK